MASLVELQTLSQSLAKTDCPNDFVLLYATDQKIPLICIPKEMKSQIHALTYFVSGLVYRVDDTTKAGAFFSEGIKLLNGEFLNIVDGILESHHIVCRSR